MDLLTGLLTTAFLAGGVLALPDAASWCTCSYLNQGTIALKPVLGRQSPEMPTAFPGS